MYGRGNYSHQHGQTRASVPPPYQQHNPSSIPASTSMQPVVPPPSTVNQAPGTSSHSGLSVPPVYEYPLPPPPPTAPHASSYHVPTSAMPRAVTSSQSHINAPLPPGPPLIPISMPMPSSQLSAQWNSRRPLHVGSLNPHSILTPLPPPPLAGPSRPDFPRTAPPLGTIPPIQGQSAYWSMVNPKPPQLNNVQGALHSSTSSHPSPPISSGSVLISDPGKVPGSLITSLAPPPPASSPPPPPPAPPQPSFASHASSSTLLQQCKSEQTERSHDSAMRSLASSDKLLNPSQMGIDAPMASGRKSEDVRRSFGVGTQAGDGSLDGGPSLGIPPAPPKPKEEKIVQKIEILCQFIAKNGPGFEDMARKREYGNPEFLFLFGGAPGSEAAIAHDYFQWVKKRHCLIRRFPEGIRHSPLGHSDVSSTVESEKQKNVPISNAHVDSDMEMEDDIAHSDKDDSIIRPADDVSCNTDLVQMESDMKEQSQVLHGLITLSPKNLSKPIMATSKGQSDSDSPCSAELPLGGITRNFPAVQASDLSLVENRVDKKLGQIISSGRPFKLLQDYASDDNSETSGEACRQESLVVDPRSLAAEPTSVSQDVENVLCSTNPKKTEKAVEPLGESNNTCKSLNSSTEQGNLYKKTVNASFIRGAAYDHNYEHRVKQESSYANASSGGLQQQGSLSSHSDCIHDSGKSVKEIAGNSFGSGPAAKVDKFGRLLREGVSDSDSDESSHERRHGKRGRNRSRSQSPRVRSRRSPQHNRWEKRRHTPSWSPRRRRSRSRSKSRSPLRHVKKFGGDSMRRDRGRMLECFDFIQGRCYRGASCRYLHHETGIEGRRRPWRKQRRTEIPSDPDRFIAVEEMKDMSPRVLNQANCEAKNQSMQLSEEMPDGSFNSAGHGKGEGPFRGSSEDHTLAMDQSAGEFVSSEVRNGGHTVIDQLLEERPVKEVRDSYTLGTGEPMGTHRKTAVNNNMAVRNPSMDSFEADTDVASLSTNDLPHPINASSLPNSSSKNVTSFQDASDFPCDLHQLPQPVTSDAGIQDSSPIPGSQFTTPAASATVQPVFSEGVPDILPNHQPLLFAATPHPTFNDVPPGKRGTATAVTAEPGVCKKHQQGYLAHSTDIGSQTLLSSCPTGLTPNHNGQFQHQGYSATREPCQSQVNSSNQTLASFPAHDLPGYSAGGPGISGELITNSMQPFCGSGSLAELTSSSRLQPYLPLSGLQYMGGSSDQDVARRIGTSVYPPDLNDRSHTSFASDYGGSRLINHYNTYTSSFEENHFQENFPNRYGTPLSNLPTEVQGLGSVESGPVSSSMKSSAAVKQSGGDQYDPIFDSIAPSSNSIKKVDDTQKREFLCDSDVMRMAGSNKPLDVEENNKRKEIGAFIPSTSLDDDGFGETADAEVGVVENASPSNHIDEEDDMAGEVEIDQVKSPGKRNKRKEPRSVKLFKSSIADFVKEVLRPSWRQGNMSKEAFKTIVKKTVDKVAGAMKSHHIPKSQVKINQYIDSSQRKLTKLVMGYVDKYVKT